MTPILRRVCAAAVVAVAANLPATSQARVETPLLMAFIGTVDVDVSAGLSRLSPAVRKAIESRIEIRHAYRPGLVIPAAAERDDDDKEMWKARRDFESGLVALANVPNARVEALAFVQDLRLSYEWEGEPGGPLSEAEYGQRYLSEHPRTRLGPAIDLFLLHRYRSAFEAAALQVEVERVAGAGGVRARAAAGYQATWNRLEKVTDVVIKAIAEDLDEQAYVYQNAGGQHPRRSK